MKATLTRLRFIALILFLGLSIAAFAQKDSLKSYTTTRIIGNPPVIDGLPDDAAWEQVPWGGGDFRQREPDAGAAPSVQTLFKILYDDKNLYILFKNLDPEPSKIVKRMSRRDGFEGDWVEVNIDSYYDKRTAFSFTSSVSGVKGDEYVSNNGNNWDSSWDPIWYLKTSVVGDGWIAELRIPLSQLRFGIKDEQIWGLQITRRFFRNQERSNWQYIPPDASGWVHLFGELRGIKGIKPQNQLEIQPYVLAQTETYQKEAGNPYRTGKESSLAVGLDAKIGITSDITLDLTINPDFGQVEADPSQLNLSAFQLYFQERRPFFIEGNNILNFNVTDNNNLFYSRRIGRSPQGTVDTDESGEDNVEEYVQRENQTTILGAAKITGKNKNGFSWGVLESVTSAEQAEIDSLGYKRHQDIEPLTNYFVARAQQDINKGNTIVGGMITSTYRDIQDSRLDWLHKNAYTGGIDIQHNWNERKYYVSGKIALSRVIGTDDAISNTQTSSVRYFQRPDNRYEELDESRTSLTGTGAIFTQGKQSGKFIYEVSYSLRSPSLELNDIGFLAQTDAMDQSLWAQYRIQKPFGKFRSMRFNFNQYAEWDFGWTSLYRGIGPNAHAEFKNFWSTGTGFNIDGPSTSNADLRGGPAMHYPGSTGYWFYVGTDTRKKFQIYTEPNWSWGNEDYSKSASYYFSLKYTPTNSLTLSVEPSFNTARENLQYVITQDVGSEKRYVLAELNQTTVRFTMRATYVITPNLTIQYWGQPFGTSGKYSNFKTITKADAPSYKDRFMYIPSESAMLNDGTYSVDENNDGTPEYSFDNPDFNFGQFRSNMVIRWEYVPGSTLFLVWTQEQNGEFFDPSAPDHRRYDFVFSEKARNIFLLKFTYRFLL